ncbi:unnamed protein product, partial [Heterotrigona itama]
FPPHKKKKSLFARPLFVCLTCFWKCNLKIAIESGTNGPCHLLITLRFFEFSILVVITDGSQRASHPKKEEDRKTAIERACNKWLIILWMGNASKKLEVILVTILLLCPHLEFVACIDFIIKVRYIFVVFISMTFLVLYWSNNADVSQMSLFFK